MSDEVVLTQYGQVLLITINRPEARNAVNLATSRALAAAADRLDSDPHLAVGVLTGAGGNFCAGMDLKAFIAGEQPALPGRGFGGITMRPPAKPLIAAVEGYALAGGCELVLACDLVIAAQDAQFGVPEVKRGLVAAAGGLLRLPRSLPRNVAMQMVLAGDFLTAADAHRLGLVNELTSPGAAVRGALDLAQRIAANGPLAIEASKQVILQSADWSSEDMWRRQSALTDPIFSSADAHEGAKAFAEKRPPVWTGA